MSSNGFCFVEWKEEYISQERGNRVVHYFLKDSVGESILAVVGTERSVRHMFYVVAEEFLDACGTKNSVHAGFKWRSRREVVDWLTSMLSKQHIPGDRSKSPTNETAHILGSCNFSLSGFSAWRTSTPDYTDQLARDLKGHDSDIVWSGVEWTCGKKLKHYPAFCRNGTTIAIQSFVFVMAKDEDHYLAYLEDMYEDKKEQKKVKVRWFHHNQEVKGVIPVRNSHAKEVFITPYAQVISVECVDGPATVLTPEHYEKCLDVFPRASITRIHLCYRQFRNNRVKPFDLSKLRGYFDQAIFSCLDANSFIKPNFACRDLTVEEDEFCPGEHKKLGGKRTRSCRARQRFVADVPGARSSRGSQLMTSEPVYKNIKHGLSKKKLLPIKHIEPLPRQIPFCKVDEKIELLCQDSGIRGCWFRCTVLLVSRKQIRVQYDDVQDEDGTGYLKEWIPAFRLATPDKLGMRCSGRPTIRPGLPYDQMDHAFDVGVPVDAWWSDGWWEGVVTGVDNRDDHILQVYFPGENLFLNTHRKSLRISKDWVGDQWVDLKAKPDILSAISAAISPDNKLSMSSTISKDTKFDGFSASYQKDSSSTKVNVVEEEKLDLVVALDAKFDGFSVSAPPTTRLDVVEENKLDSAAATGSDVYLEDADLVHGKKAQSVNNDGNRNDDDTHYPSEHNTDDAHCTNEHNTDGDHCISEHNANDARYPIEYNADDAHVNYGNGDADNGPGKSGCETAAQKSEAELMGVVS